MPPSQHEDDNRYPAAKSAFEMSPARHRPNVPDMMSIARGKELRDKVARRGRSVACDA